MSGGLRRDQMEASWEMSARAWHDTLMRVSSLDSDEALQARRVVFREGMSPVRVVERGREGTVSVVGPADPLETAATRASPPLVALSAVAAARWTREMGERGVSSSSSSGDGKTCRSPPESEVLVRTSAWTPDVQRDLVDMNPDEALACPRTSVVKTCAAKGYAPISGGTVDLLFLPRLVPGSEPDLRILTQLVFQSAQLFGRRDVVLVLTGLFPPGEWATTGARIVHSEAIDAVCARGAFESVVLMVDLPELLPPPIRQTTMTTVTGDEGHDGHDGGRRSQVPSPPPSARPSCVDEKRGERDATVRIAFVVRAEHADTDLEDRMDEWEFEGGLGRAFPHDGRAAGGSLSVHREGEEEDDIPMDVPEHRRPLSAKDRRMTLRLLRQQAHLLLATLVARRIPSHADSIRASAVLDTPLARLYIDVCAERCRGSRSGDDGVRSKDRDTGRVPTTMRSSVVKK